MLSFLDRLFAGHNRKRRAAVRRRNLLGGIEKYETRCVMDGNCPWHNTALSGDANQDGNVTQADYDLVSSELEASGWAAIPWSSGAVLQGKPDATNDWVVDQNDLTFITGAMTSGTGSGSGSGSGTGSSTGTATGTGSGTGTASGAGYFDISPAQVDEGGQLVFKVTFHVTSGTVSGPSVSVVSEQYQGNIGPMGYYADGGASSGGTGVGDYTVRSETMIFTGFNGESHDFVCNAQQDSIVEWSELMQCRVTAVQSSNGANLSGVNNKATGMIFDDDTATADIRLAPGGSWPLEGSATVPGSATFNVEFSNPVQLRYASFNYATVDGHAVAGEDYVATNKTWTLDPLFIVPFPANGFTINIPFVGDSVLEETLQDFTVNLTGGVAGKLTIGSAPGLDHAYVMIQDEDIVTLDIVPTAGTMTATEGNNINVVAAITGSSRGVGGAAFDVGTTGGTALANDGTGGDYTWPISNTSLTINPQNGATQDWDIHTINDTTLEMPTETFSAWITNFHPTGALANDVASRFVIGTTNTATATINDNEAPVTVSIADSTGYERWLFTPGATTWDFTVTLSGRVDVPVVVNYYLLSNGSPGFVFGTDITEASGTLFSVTIAAGQTTGTITLHPVADAPDAGETMQVLLWSFTGLGGRNVTIGDGTAIGTLEESP